MPVVVAPAFLFFIQIVCQVCGKPFTPVTFFWVHIDRISKPGVEYLVAQGGIHNEWKSCHLLPEKGVSGKAVACGGTVFHYCKSLERVWAKEAFI